MDTKVSGFWGYLHKMLYDFRDTCPHIFRDTGYWGPLPGPHFYAFSYFKLHYRYFAPQVNAARHQPMESDVS